MGWLFYKISNYLSDNKVNFDVISGNFRSLSDELAASAWINKYALKDSQGKIYEQTPADMHNRLADEIVRIERKYPNS